jgi:hypothetical protein
MPIGQWVELVGKHLPILKPHDIYEPVTLAIKTSGRIASSDGAVNHVVNIDDTNWHADLCRELCTVAFGMPAADARHIELRAMDGTNIAGFSHAQLQRAGKDFVRIYYCLAADAAKQ